jgi:hypothetical protein
MIVQHDGTGPDRGAQAASRTYPWLQKIDDLGFAQNQVAKKLRQCQKKSPGD